MLVRKNPRMGLRALAAELHEYEKQALLARPSGAVVRVPELLSKDTIRRYAPIFHNFVSFPLLPLEGT